MKKFIENNRFQLFFVVLMLSMCLFYGYLKIFHFSPRSTHNWRQTDCASIVLNYYQNGLDFSKPQMHFVMSGDGYVTGAGEAPVFYYLAAVAYKIFGAHDGIYRLLSLLTFLLGLFLIAKMLAIEIKDWFSPVILAGIIMASPVIAFYSFNFTPNIPAQGLAMIGIWFFYRFYKTKKIKHFYWSMLIYAIAGLIKISALMSFIVILGLFVLDITGILQRFKEQRIFHKAWRFIPGFLMIILSVYLWKIWADQYNETHQAGYFLSTIRPFWEADGGTQMYILYRISKVWGPDYFSPVAYWPIILLFFSILFTPQKHKPILYIIFLAIFLGCLGFLALWFKQFDVHDYYAIELFLLPITVLILSFIFIKKRYPKLLHHTGFRVCLLIFLAYNVYYAKDKIDYRYNPTSVFMKDSNQDLYKTKELQSYLKTLGIAYPDKVVSAPDISPNNTLYHYNLMGWTELYMSEGMHSRKVKACAKAGAKYLLINKKEYLEKENMKEVYAYPLGNFNNSIFVFDIRPFANEE